MATTEPPIGSDEVRTLKHLALIGALETEEKLSCAGLADRLDTSTQTASRRLQRLEDSGCIVRETVSDGQWIEITDAGEQRLQAEYASYRRIFEGDVVIELAGSVTSGMGEGRHYITLDGYMAQFKQKLGYEPYPGTLNIDLTEQSIRARASLDAFEPITIEGWESDDRTYGPAYCYRAAIEADGQRYENAHIIAPERTHHGDDHLELIAADELRAELGLEDGAEVAIFVTE